MPKLWMVGFGTLCAIAHYRAALYGIKTQEEVDKLNLIELKQSNSSPEIARPQPLRLPQ